MGYLSRYAENKILDHVLGNGAFTKPDALFIGLATADIIDTDTGGSISEMSGGDYARIAFDAWTTASGRMTINNTVYTFPTPSADWGIAKAFAILDTSTLATGNIIAYGEWSPARMIESGASIDIKLYQIQIGYMKNGASNYLANATLDHLFTGIPLTPPANLYLALSTVAVVDTDTGTTISEPADLGYNRELINNWSAASEGQSVNEDDYNSEIALADWGDIMYFILCDALTTGNNLYYGSLATAKTIDTNDYLHLEAGDIRIKVD